MNEFWWFIAGIVIGVLLDIPIVKILLRPVNQKIAKIEKSLGDKND